MPWGEKTKMQYFFTINILGELVFVQYDQDSEGKLLLTRRLFLY